LSTLVSEERGEVLSSVEQDSVALTAQAASALAQAAYALALVAQAQGSTAEQRADAALADAQLAIQLANQALAESDGDPKLSLTGGTLSGFLTLHDEPLSSFHAATKSYVDFQFSNTLVNYYSKSELYTKAESDSLYLTRSSPTVAAGPLTLAQDGSLPYHAVTVQQAQAELANVIPTGVIVMWSGSIATIPSGWALCNGSNGTPNLRDRFIVGAGTSYNPGNTGGATTHSHPVTVNAHNLTLNQMPQHFHSLAMQTSQWELPGQGFAAGALFVDRIIVTASSSLVTFNQGGGQGHTHTATTTAVSSLPPYYALAYIMKL
jgi:hypothetical protein